MVQVQMGGVMKTCSSSITCAPCVTTDGCEQTLSFTFTRGFELIEMNASRDYRATETTKPVFVRSKGKAIPLQALTGPERSRRRD
jgi:hypothetical protein